MGSIFNYLKVGESVIRESDGKKFTIIRVDKDDCIVARSTHKGLNVVLRFYEILFNDGATFDKCLVRRRQCQK